jgi:hypothetical protein
MGQRVARNERGTDMNRFHHFIIIDSEGKTLVGERIDTIRAVTDGGNGQCDQGLFAFRQLSGTGGPSGAYSPI